MPIQGYFGEGSMLASLPLNSLSGAGFVVCPLVWLDASRGGCSAEMIYRLAYERAQAALRPSWYERLYLGSPN